MEYRRQPLEVGNFTCLFGQTEMLEAFGERILPVFTKLKLIPWGRGEERSFVFYKFRVEKIVNDYFLVGKIVRNMKIQSSQKYDAGSEDLKKRKRTLEDSPSTIFLLRLSDHKVVIVRQMSRAPNLSQIEKFITKAFKNHWRQLYQKELLNYRKRLKKKNLTKELREIFEITFRNAYPLPNFRITAMLNGVLVANAFARAKTLEQLSVTLHHTNNEDPRFRSAFLKQLKIAKTTVGRGATTSVKATISDKEAGLSVTNAKEIAQDLVKSGGNASFTAKATDENGIDFNIKDDDISIKDTIDSETHRTDHEKELEAVSRLNVHVPPASEENVGKAQEIFLTMRKNEEQ